jgi:hypothetical protein
MSVRLPQVIQGGASAEDIWSYSRRTLTERFTIIERARGYTRYAIEVFNLTSRFRNSRFVFIRDALASAFVKNRSTDVIPNSTETILDPYFTSIHLIKDHDDETYAYRNAVINAGQTIDHVVYDLGSVKRLFLRSVISSGISGLFVRVQVSVDGSIYSTVCMAHGSEKCVYYGDFRYIKLQSYNSNTYGVAGSYARFHSIEAYPPDTNEEIVFTNETGNVLALLWYGHYHLLEVITL